MSKQEETLQFLKNNPWNFYYTDIKPHSTTPKERGTDIWGFINDTEVLSTAYYERRKRIDETGAMINLVPIPAGWYGVDQYDYEMVDHVMDQVMKEFPDRYCVPRFLLDAPYDWCRENPEELCVFWQGPTDLEEIRSLVGTEYQVSTGSTEGPERLGRQSFSSKKWQKDAQEALRRLVEHLENGPYADRIVAYFPMFGEVGGENLWWGFWPKKASCRGDFGHTHRKMFFRWAVEKYGSLEALRKAWNMPELTEENLPIPTPEDTWSYYIENWKETKDIKKLLLADDQRQVDCNEFHSVCTFDAMELFAKTIKEMTGKPVGTFYGYTLEPAPGYCGQLMLERALNSPWFDFYSAPKSYAYCLGGDPGESQAPAQSVVRKKLWIEENDMRSYNLLKNIPKDTRSPKTQSDTITCFWRELYRALTGGYGFWWMDIYGLKDDWYTDEVMIDMFKKQSAFFKKWSPNPRKSVTEVLWVEDDESLGHMATRWSIQEGLRRRLNRELRLCGAPMDRYRMSDLFEMDLSQYKFIIFQHAFVLPKEKWDILLKRIRPDAHILWNYAAGLLDPHYNPENQKAVTGFNTMETPDRMEHVDLYRHIYHHAPGRILDDYPHLSIVPEEGQEILQMTPDQYILTAKIKRGQGVNIYAADITLRTPLLRQMMEDAGVTFYAPEHCAVYADDKLAGFFPRFDVVVNHVFEGTWRNVLTGETVSGEVSVPIRAKKLAIFEKLK